MGCGEFLVKYILFFANLVFALAGLALLGLGIAAQLQVSVITDLADGNLQVAPISSMVVGGIIFLISFFGCCGAIRESNCMLVTYSIAMLVLMIAKLTLAILIFVRLDDVLAGVPNWLNRAFTTDQQGFHEIEKAFQCCGPTGPLSYGTGVISLPTSCCATPPCNVVNAYKGCGDLISDFLRTFGNAFGFVLIAVVAIELVAVVFGLCLANHVRNKSRRARY